MNCMTLIALIVIFSSHILKVGLIVFLLVVACFAQNSMAHDHLPETEQEKNKHLYEKKSFFITKK